MTVNESILTCPICGFKETLKMPSDSCMILYICSKCNSQLRPKDGDCCVFCSYGNIKCPVKQ